MEPHPRLRPEIDAVPVQHNDETMFMLHDQSQLSTAKLAVNSLVMYIASHLDGKASILQIQERFQKDTNGQTLSLADLEHVLEMLEQSMFLCGARFDDYLAQVKREFLQNPVRPPQSAGSAYSADPDALAASLNTMLESAPPPEENPPLSSFSQLVCPAAAIAPHIDYPRGGAGYGQLYRILQTRTPPKTVIVLGTSHQPIKNRVSILAKDFEIPGTVIRHDIELTQRILSETCAFADFTEDSFAHRSEHSIELQLVWLRHIWGDDFQIVPILIGSMQDFINEKVQVSDASTDPQINAFVTSLHTILQERSDILLLASADLAHIGPGFMDTREIDDAFLEEVETADRAYLHPVGQGDALGALSSLQAHNDRYHVCGTGCIYMLNAILPGKPGWLLGYHQATTPEMKQSVSFAAMLFEQKERTK